MLFVLGLLLAGFQIKMFNLQNVNEGFFVAVYSTLKLNSSKIYDYRNYLYCNNIDNIIIIDNDN